MALPNTNITVGKPPLLWHNVQDALVKINENFDSVAAALGVAGLTPIDFETLDTNVSPTADNTYSLGAISTNRWKALYTAEYAATVSDANNGIHLGAAHIKGISGTIDLPYGSTVSGNLIIDPDKTFFKSVQVDNSEQVVAGDFSDTLNLLSGNGISMNVDSSAESITIDNTGILNITAGSGISRTIVSGTATITNAGVRSLQSVTALPSGRTLGAGINIDNATGDNVKVTNTGVLEIQAGSAALTISTDAATGIVTITNAAPAGNAFRNVIVNSDTPNPIEANSVAGVLNLNQGAGITLTKNVITDTITFAVDPTFDLKGSVFGDDSSMLIDGVAGRIVGPVYTSTLRTSEVRISLGDGAGSATIGVAIAIGNLAGATNQHATGLGIGFRAAFIDQGSGAVAIGVDAGNTTQGANSVALGNQAGETSQGANAIAIGFKAGETSQTAGSIVINASGVALNGAAAGFYVDPIRSTATATGPAMYNPTTKELFYNTVLEFAGSTISTNDSSGITVDVQTTFNTDVTFENDITVAERLTVKGSRVINLNDLKALSAASTSFADFQAKIATMV
jgi:hypothetical protein